MESIIVETNEIHRKLVLILKVFRGDNMNLFDIVGPVMVGPSSSHTAGAVKIGYVSRKFMAQPIVKAQILLYGSLLAT